MSTRTSTTTSKIEQRAESLDDDELDDAYFLALGAGARASRRPVRRRLPHLAVRPAVGRPTNVDPARLPVHGRAQRAIDRPAAAGLLHLLPPALRRSRDFTDEEKPDEVFFRLDQPRRRVHRRPAPLCRARRRMAKRVHGDTPSHLRGQGPTGAAGDGGLAAGEHGHGDDGHLPRRDEAARRPGSRPSPGERGRRSRSRSTRSPSAALSRPLRGALPRLPRLPRRDHASATSTRRPRRRSRRSLPAGQRLPATRVLAVARAARPQGYRSAGRRHVRRRALRALDAAGGKVVNRSRPADRAADPGVPIWGPWHLEPAWLVVVAAALCQQGRLEIGFDGQPDRRARARRG